MAYKANNNELEDTIEQNKSVSNTANNIRNAADVAMTTANPYAVGASAALKAADKLTDGEASERLSQVLSNVNRNLPMPGKSSQESSLKKDGVEENENQKKLAQAKEKMSAEPETEVTTVETGDLSAEEKNNQDILTNKPKKKSNIKLIITIGLVFAFFILLIIMASSDNLGLQKIQPMDTRWNYLYWTMYEAREECEKNPYEALHFCERRDYLTCKGDGCLDPNTFPEKYLYNVMKEASDSYSDSLPQYAKTNMKFKEINPDNIALHLKRIELQDDPLCYDINGFISSITEEVNFDDMLNAMNSTSGVKFDDTEFTLDLDESDMKSIESFDSFINIVGMPTFETCPPDDPTTVTKIECERMRFFSKWIARYQFVYKIYEFAGSCKSEATAIYNEAKNDTEEHQKNKKNWIYYLYYPAYDEKGRCVAQAPSMQMLRDIPAEKVLPFGFYYTDTYFYWFLHDKFVPLYYKDMLPPEDDPFQKDEREKLITRYSDRIYLQYIEAGPDPVCEANANFEDNESGLATNISVENGTCAQGINVEGVGRIPLEDYVAGVVSREAYTNEGMEALKAQAVAARTYALYSTNNCQKTIGNSNASQAYTDKINSRAREATLATKGIVMTYNGKLFSAQYDSFCYDDSDCPDSKRNSDGSYTVIYTKVPSGEKQKITLRDSNQYPRILKGQGHAHGMSQLVSYQLAKEGKDYKDILRYFYSDGVEFGVKMSFSTWLQYDSRWKNVRLGDFEGTELGPIGCYVTSLAIMIARSGVPTTLGESFNPGTFAKALKANGAFSAGGGFKSADYIYSIAPNFRRWKNVTYTSISELAEYANSGRYYIMLNIHHPSEHHLVVNSVDVVNNKIYVSDPGGFGTELFQAFPKNLTINSFTIYRVE